MSCNCGSNNPNNDGESAYFPTIPFCPDAIQQSQTETNKGKYFDRNIESFVMPKVGKQVNVHIPDSALWSKGMWVGIAYGNTKTLFMLIAGKGVGYIRLVNGCNISDDEPIVGNPDPGTEIPADSIIYAVPPQCDTGACATLSNLIATCGVDGVLMALANSPNICFANVLDLENAGQEVFFAGLTKPNDDCDCEGIVARCLRAVIKIFTGSAGRTMCMPEAPTTNDADVIVDSSPVSKKYAYFDEKGCLKKGRPVGTCNKLTSINSADGEQFDGIIVCKDGEQRYLPAVGGKQLIGITDVDGLNPKWTVQSITGIDYLTNLLEIYNVTGSVDNTATVDLTTKTGYDKKYSTVWLKVFIAVTASGSSGSINAKMTIQGYPLTEVNAAAASSGVDENYDTMILPMKIPTSKIITITKDIGISGSFTSNCTGKVSIYAWA